jgi:hypothetical protein
MRMLWPTPSAAYYALVHPHTRPDDVFQAYDGLLISGSKTKMILLRYIITFKSEFNFVTWRKDWQYFFKMPLLLYLGLSYIKRIHMPLSPVSYKRMYTLAPTPFPVCLHTLRQTSPPTAYVLYECPVMSNCELNAGRGCLRAKAHECYEALHTNEMRQEFLSWSRNIGTSVQFNSSRRTSNSYL